MFNETGIQIGWKKENMRKVFVGNLYDKIEKEMG
jgi:hypothetical protein